MRSGVQVAVSMSKIIVVATKPLKNIIYTVGVMIAADSVAVMNVDDAMIVLTVVEIITLSIELMSWVP